MRWIQIIILLSAVFLAPFAAIRMTTGSLIISDINKVSPAGAALIFGAHINHGQPTEVLKERLDTAILLYQKKLASKLVVSNRERASEVMVNYLLDHNIPAEAIEIDQKADVTTDTCREEYKRHAGKRKIFFVSQKFHLPRLIYQCRKVGLNGIGIDASDVTPIGESKAGAIEKISVKIQRNFREMYLSWLTVLDIYR